MSHVYSFPPQCSNCRKFMPYARSKMVREYSGTQMNPDCDDMEVGVCANCEASTQKEGQADGLIPQKQNKNKT